MYVLASFPGAQKKMERTVWYPLFAHVWLPRFFLGNLETTVILVSVARPFIAESWELLHLDIALFVQQSHLYALSKVGKPGRTNN